MPARPWLSCARSSAGRRRPCPLRPRGRFGDLAQSSVLHESSQLAARRARAETFRVYRSPEAAVPALPAGDRPQLLRPPAAAMAPPPRPEAEPSPAGPQLAAEAAPPWPEVAPAPGDPHLAAATEPPPPPPPRTDRPFLSTRQNV